MDRQTEYPGQILPETVLLQMAKDSMVGLAKLSAAVLGTSAIANGFAVTPTGPASLQVLVAPGEIYSPTAIDATAYSSLGADTTHSIMKQGILLDGLTLNCAAPGTTGQSINYLIEATYQDLDANPVLLPYYNSANPALPFSGMGNNGLTQNTSRKGAAVVQVKAGASATTGSQVTPAPDAGFSGLYVVTVAYGQTTITSASISQYVGAPLLPAGLIPAVQSSAMTSAMDFGTAGVYKASYFPAITALANNETLVFEVKTANPGASTFSPNGLGPYPVVGSAHSPLQGGEFVVGGKAEVIWSAALSSWILLGCTGGAMQVGLSTQSQQAIPLGQANNLYGGNTTLVSASGPTSLTSTNAGLVSIDATAGAITVTLPLASASGSSFQFVRADATANIVTISRAGSDLIGGVSAITLTGQYSAVNLRSNSVSAWTFVSSAQRGIARFIAGGSWTCPAGITVAYVSGAGAGGGGAGGTTSNAGSGGGAGYSDIRRVVSVVPGTVYTIIIGAAGNGGALNSGGSSGGITSMGALVSLSGGVGGSTAGPGGSPGGGPFSQAGQTVSSTIAAVGGLGGSSAFGGGGQGGLGANTGIPGAPNSGAGGGGGGGGGSGNIGAAGGSGLLILEW